MPGKRGAPEARFWRHVDLQLGGCWIWMGALSRGYGQLRGHDRVVYAHRFAYELLIGPIPPGLQTDHWRCLPTPNRRCVNPAHLRLVTNKQNNENKPIFSSNRSGYRGVSLDTATGRWIAQVGHHGCVVRVGSFPAPEDAGSAARDIRNALFTHNDPDRYAAAQTGPFVSTTSGVCRRWCSGRECGQRSDPGRALCETCFSAVVDRTRAKAG